MSSSSTPSVRGGNNLQEEKVDTNDNDLSGGGKYGQDVKNGGGIETPRSNESASGTNNISTLVAKSKKVASSLFTLLHAKNCRLGVDRCSHPGCSDAKLIHLHLKTCSAKGDSECPENRKGCIDARKLLAHYRRCRDIRARQTTAGTRQHLCLVCSLVARYAKGGGCDFDRSGRNASPRGTRPTVIKHPFPSANNVSYAIGSSAEILLNLKGGMNAPKKMPPPPPRFPFSGVSSISSCNNSSCNNERSGDFNSRPRAESLDIRHSSQSMYGRVDIRVTATNSSEFNSNSTHQYQNQQEQELGDFGEVDTTSKLNYATGRRRSMSCTEPSRNAVDGPGPLEVIEEEFKNIIS